MQVPKLYTELDLSLLYILILVVFTSSRTARLELTKVLDAGRNWE